jgi:hypothetical protein
MPEMNDVAPTKESFEKNTTFSPWRTICQEPLMFTQAMEIPGVGCVVRIVQHQEILDSSVLGDMAITFIPGTVLKDVGGGFHMVVKALWNRRYD